MASGAASKRSALCVSLPLLSHRHSRQRAAHRALHRRTDDARHVALQVAAHVRQRSHAVEQRRHAAGEVLEGARVDGDFFLADRLRYIRRSTPTYTTTCRTNASISLEAHARKMA